MRGIYCMECGARSMGPLPGHGTMGVLHGPSCNVGAAEERACQEPLTRCPFCDGEPVRPADRVLRDGCKDGEPDAYAYSFRCRSCAATGGWSKGESGARMLWNMRPARSR